MKKPDLVRNSPKQICRTFGDTPEKRLLGALISSVDPTNLDDQRWLQSTSTEPFSFLWVCEHLDLAPNIEALSDYLSDYVKSAVMYHKDYGEVTLRRGLLVAVFSAASAKYRTNAKVIGWDEDKQAVRLRYTTDRGITFYRHIDDCIIPSLQPKRNGGNHGKN